jgi:hypothetical protein
MDVSLIRAGEARLEEQERAAEAWRFYNNQ